MAEKEDILQELEEELECPGCLLTYHEPKLLHCGHAYCTVCLNSDEVQESPGGLICPACQQLTAGDVESLQCAFHIAQALEILEGLRQLQALTSSSSEQKGAGGEVEKAEQCRVHVGELLRVECVPCKKLVCFRCVSEGGGHCGHSYTRIRGQEGEQACRIVPSCGAAQGVSNSSNTAHSSHGAQAEEVSIQTDRIDSSATNSTPPVIVEGICTSVTQAEEIGTSVTNTASPVLVGVCSLSSQVLSCQIVQVSCSALNDPSHEIIEKIEQLLQCSVCLDTLDNPRNLHCGHVCCHACLDPLQVQTPAGVHISCPSCIQVTASDVAGLQPAAFYKLAVEALQHFKTVTSSSM